MTITRSMIQVLAGSRKAYEEGNAIFQMGRVQLRTTNSFWKDEIKVTAEAGAEHEAQKQVSLTIRNGRIAASRCSCMSAESRKGYLCAHGVAAALTWVELMENQETESPAFIRNMIENYGQIRQQEVVADYTVQTTVPEELVHLLPVFTLEGQRLALSLKIGSSKYYRVRDISVLMDCFAAGKNYIYGKFLEFYHVPQAFDEESLQFLMILKEIHDRILERPEYRKPGPQESCYSGDCSRLVIGERDMDRLFDGLSDPLAEAEETLSDSGMFRMVRSNPELTVYLRYRSNIRHELGGNLFFKEKLLAFSGIRHLYILQGDRLWIADEAFSHGLQPFFQGLMEQKQEQPITVRICDGDMAGFYTNVLPSLHQFMQVDCGNIDFQSYLSRQLRTEFYFDLQGEMEITLKILHYYGKECFNPILGEQPVNSWRDRAQEKKIALMAARYFDRRYPDKGLLTTYQDEQSAIYLAADGFADFAKLGEIHLSDALQELKIRKPSRLQFQVQAFSDWLELSVDMEGVSQQELYEILNQYEEKKSYYQMKDGSYVLLHGQEMDILPELMEGLQISAKDVTGKISHISGSRALYLKKLFEQYQTSWSHDAWFEKLTDCLEKQDGEPEPVPEGWEAILRDYQVKGYQWLAMLDRMGFGGILADDMGLGKTVQMIALLEKIYESESGKKYVELSTETDTLLENIHSDACSVEEKRPTLIVCPSSLIYNWEREIHRFAPELTTVLITGTGKERKQLLKDGPQAQVWITSYDLLRRDIAMYENQEFRVQVLDEAQYIKNQGTQNAKAVKKIQAVRRFALTGTPIENRLGELWSIFDYLMPGFLYSYARFRRIFEMPLSKDRDERVVSRLHNMISPFILRRLKKDVLTELPEKCDTLLYPVLEGEQKKLYTANAAQLKKFLEHESEDSFRRNRTTILADLTRLREICCAPSLVYEDFHAPNAKLEALMELVHSCLEGEHRILIFSQFARMLNLIEQRLDEEAIPCFKLTGQTSKQERQQLVERFSEGEVPVFLISLKAGGTGLNLTQADTVIHYDPWWNVAAQNQATDRAHRIGQTKEVNVYRMIAAGTIEENILKLQEVKQNLVDQVLAGGQVSLAELTREELMELL